jgi:hypothetical protein
LSGQVISTAFNVHFALDLPIRLLEIVTVSAVCKSVSLSVLVDFARGHKGTESLVDLVRVAAQLVREFLILAQLE